MTTNYGRRHPADRLGRMRRRGRASRIAATLVLSAAANAAARCCSAAALVSSCRAMSMRPVGTSAAHRPWTSLGMSPAGHPAAADLGGKVAYQRFLYKLAPRADAEDEDAPDTAAAVPCCVEERVRFRIGAGRELVPFGPKTFLLREGPPRDDAELPEDAEQLPEGFPPGGTKTYQRVGEVLHRMDVEEAHDADDFGGTVWDSSVVSALFFSSHPGMDLMKGQVLELGTGVGFGGLMSCVAAGATAKAKAGSGGDDALSSSVKGLTLADFNEEVLNLASRNADNSGLPAGVAVDVAEVDWTRPVPDPMAGRYDLVLGNDIAYHTADVEHVARFVASSLTAVPSDEGPGREAGGRFVHIGPRKRDAIANLGKLLRREHGLDVDIAGLELRRYDLAPMLLDSLAEEEAAEADLVGEKGGQRRGFVEFQNQSNQQFSCLIAVAAPRGLT